MKEYFVLGTKVNGISVNECLKVVDEAIQKNKKIQICTTNNEFIVEARRNKRFQDIINSSDISTADSTGVVWAISKIYSKKVQRIPGIDLFLELCKIAPKKNYRIFLLGGGKNVALKAKKILQKKYIGIHIVGNIDGIEIDPDKKNDELISAISKARPDILAVSLGAPKQELWIDKNKKLLNAKVYIGLGGTLDYIAQIVPRAPSSMRKSGLEWLFRLFTQPTRISRIFKAVVVFPILVSIYGTKKD